MQLTDSYIIILFYCMSIVTYCHNICVKCFLSSTFSIFSLFSNKNYSFKTPIMFTWCKRNSFWLKPICWKTEKCISFCSMAGGLMYSYFTFNIKSSPRATEVHEVRIHVDQSSTQKVWPNWTPRNTVVLFCSILEQQNCCNKIAAVFSY